MKLALLSDRCRQESYEIRNGKSYRLNSDIPYQFSHSINNECHIGFWSYPKLFGDGYFIKVTEAELPDLDLDVIILTLETAEWKNSLERIRNKYKNALIIGTIKEPSLVKIEFLNSCDKIALQYSKINLKFTKDWFWLPQPVDVNYLVNNFFTDKVMIQLFRYQHHNVSRQGLTSKFCDYISKKYNLPVVTAVTTGDNINQWRDFILSWKHSLFHVNLDPEFQFGQQATQLATLNRINIGGMNDSHFHLYPETATNDFDKLELVINKCLNDERYIHKLIMDAWDAVNKIYSLESVKNTLIKNIK